MSVRIESMISHPDFVALAHSDDFHFLSQTELPDPLGRFYIISGTAEYGQRWVRGGIELAENRERIGIDGKLARDCWHGVLNAHERLEMVHSLRGRLNSDIGLSAFYFVRGTIPAWQAYPGDTRTFISIMNIADEAIVGAMKLDSMHGFRVEFYPIGARDQHEMEETLEAQTGATAVILKHVIDALSEHIKPSNSRIADGTITLRVELDAREANGKMDAPASAADVEQEVLSWSTKIRASVLASEDMGRYGYRERAIGNMAFGLVMLDSDRVEAIRRLRYARDVLGESSSPVDKVLSESITEFCRSAGKQIPSEPHTVSRINEILAVVRDRHRVRRMTT